MKFEGSEVKNRWRKDRGARSFLTDFSELQDSISRTTDAAGDTRDYESQILTADWAARQ